MNSKKYFRFKNSESFPTGWESFEYIFFEPPSFTKSPLPCDKTMVRNQVWAQLLLFMVSVMSYKISLDFDLLTKGSKLRISTTRWCRSLKIALKTSHEISVLIFWCNKNLWKQNFKHSIIPEVDRKWHHAILQWMKWILFSCHARDKYGRNC